MKITPELIVFAMLGGPAALASLGVVLSKSAVRSALCLVFTFFILAFLYFSLGMELIGSAQIMVYAGAIMVLFVFVIMLLNPKLIEERKDWKIPAGIILGLALLGCLASQILPAFLTLETAPMANQIGGAQLLGSGLFTAYIFPFEIVSVLLLVGVVGSVFLAKKRTP